MSFGSFLESRKAVVVAAGLLTVLIAWADWWSTPAIPLGFFYLFPMSLAGRVLRRSQIAVAAALCTVLTEAFDVFEWTPAVGSVRDILMFIVFFGIGVVVNELVASHRAGRELLSQIQAESEARQEAEEQLKVFVDTSPAAIVTTNSEGEVLLANEAAHRLFGLEAGQFARKSIREYLPLLFSVAGLDRDHQIFRTTMQCQARRDDGDLFLADIWFSTYRTRAGPRLAALIVDNSEELRTREESSLQQLLAGSRIMAAAVSHEVRNVCAAIAVVHSNLSRNGVLKPSKDFEALGTLVTALEEIAAMDLGRPAEGAGALDLNSLLEELRIVIESSMRENGIEIVWSISRKLPPVWADRSSLMQVFLNLKQNSERAMMHSGVRRLTVRAIAEGQRVEVEFQDTGCGVTDPERLFRPFQRGAKATGLGLYVSRALVSSFRGGLRYEPMPSGSSFIVELALAALKDEKERLGTTDPDSFVGRPLAVSGGPQQAARG